MLRISITDTAETVAIILEGRVAGPWVAELTRTWADVGAESGQADGGDRSAQHDVCGCEGD